MLFVAESHDTHESMEQHPLTLERSHPRPHHPVETEVSWHAALGYRWDQGSQSLMAVLAEGLDNVQLTRIQNRSHVE